MWSFVFHGRRKVIQVWINIKVIFEYLLKRCLLASPVMECSKAFLLIHSCMLTTFLSATLIFLSQPSGQTAGLDALCQIPLGMRKGEEPEHKINYPSEFISHRQVGNSLDISSSPKCVVMTSIILILHCLKWREKHNAACKRSDGK